MINTANIYILDRMNRSIVDEYSIHLNRSIMDGKKYPDGWMGKDKIIDRKMDGQTEGWMDKQTDGQMDD